MPHSYTKNTKQKAQSLRKNGWSLGEISLKLHIPKNTLSGWVKDIRLSAQQEKRIREKISACAAIGRPLAVAANRIKIETWKEGIRQKVRHFGRYAYSNAEMKKLICGLLYLCEGAKYPSTRCLIFGNSDPRIIRCFLNLLRKSFDIEEDKLRCRVMYRWDQDINRLNRYWSRITNIPLKHFFKTTPDKRTKGNPTRKKFYKGVCSIQYPSTFLQFQLQAIGEIIVINGAGGARTLETSCMPCRRSPS